MHPAVIGRRIEVHADLDRVWVTCEGAIVADHARVWARHQTITDSEHAVAAKHLRHGRGDLLRPVADAAPARRSRSDRSAVYDTALGLVDAVDGRGRRDGHRTATTATTDGA